MGHIKYLSGEVAEAKDCYERTLSFLTDPSETHSIYLRLASIYLQDGEFSQARQTFLQACRSSPSCVSWLGVGIACYRVCNIHVKVQYVKLLVVLLIITLQNENIHEIQLIKYLRILSFEYLLYKLSLKDF